jgi:hypothetical protein
MQEMQEIKDAFRGIVVRDLRPIEDKDGVRVGEDVRVTKEKDGSYLVRFLKNTDEKRRKHVRDALNLKHVNFKEGKDFKD